MRKTLQYEKLGRSKQNGVGISNKIQYKFQLKQIQSFKKLNKA